MASLLLISALLLGLLGDNAAAQEFGVGVDGTLPIKLDAETSEFDRRADQLKFTQLKIQQGAIAISAQAARAQRLDFEDTVWNFSGDVVITDASTTAWCDQAEVTFSDYRIEVAVMNGGPARFEQRREAADELTEGQAETIEYVLGEQRIRMLGDARVSDGTNEVTGPRIVYDLEREVISADANGDDPVKMTILPTSEPELELP